MDGWNLGFCAREMMADSVRDNVGEADRVNIKWNKVDTLVMDNVYVVYDGVRRSC